MKLNLGNWHDDIGTSHENSQNREAPNKHIKGSKAYKEWISKKSSLADKYSNLPFTFSKPKKSTQTRKDVYAVCYGCETIKAVTKYTCGYECKPCNSYVKVTKDNSFSSEEEYILLCEKLSNIDND